MKSRVVKFGKKEDYEGILTGDFTDEEHVTAFNILNDTGMLTRLEQVIALQARIERELGDRFVLVSPKIDSIIQIIKLP